MLDIFNAALLGQGEQDIAVDSEGSDEWRLLSRNWPMIVEAELEDGAYHFTRVPHNLLTRSEGMLGFDDAYLIPQSALHVRRAWVQDASGQRYLEDWTQDGSHIHINNPDGVWIEAVEAVETGLWTANFTKGVQCRLEALIARAMREELGEARTMDEMAERHFDRARTNSSRTGRPPKLYASGPIATARRTRRRIS